MKAMAFISSMSETQCGSLIRDQFPPNTTPARARARAVTVETELQSGPFTSELRLFNLYF